MAQRSLRLSPQAIAAQYALRKVPSPFGHPTFGKGGRQSNAGITAAVFGSTGFLGKYVMAELGTRGCKVYAPYRGCELEGRHVRTSFDLGNLGQMPFSPRDDDSIRNAIRDSDVVINLIGKYYETKHVVKTRRADGTLSNINYSFEDVNCSIPAKIARIAKEQNVQAFIHMSALSANPNSQSKWSRTKFEGEKAVREEFPEAIVVRPTQMFGSEDTYLNWLAEMASLLPVVPVVNDGSTLVQPVHCVDVSRAILSILYNYKAFEGSTFMLAGPKEMTQREVLEYVLHTANMGEKSIISMPAQMAQMLGKINKLGFNPWFTDDNIAQMLEDNVLTGDMLRGDANTGNGEENVFTFADLGIEPSHMEKVTYEYLHRFRKGGHFTTVQGYH